MRQHWTKEQKAEFWAAFVRHRDEGCNIREAWQRAYADFRAEGKLAPGLRTFGNWYRAAMRPQEGSAEAANNRTHRTYRTYKENAGTDEAARDAGEVANEEAEEAEKAAPAGDYIRRLELMVLLYRRRSESDVDAVCDRLLPELNQTETEEE